jgi:hypothetical protein
MLRVFGNRVMRKRIGHKGDQITSRWRKLYKVELHDKAWETVLMHSGFLLGPLIKKTILKTGHGWKGNIYGI